MRCPYCNFPESKVIDSRPTDESNSIRRRRECLSCGKRFTTYETVESVPLVVVKKDGSRQAFDRNKILNGLVKACEKRPVSMEVLEKTVSEIEQKLLNSMDREVPSERVG
ncbi:MAG: transcriptional regulator NrdR, partial [Butyricicoccaceae bacterium]